MADGKDALPAPALSLQGQTIALGKMLKAIAVSDPGSTPSASAKAAFTSWLAEAGPGSREPDYFQDVVGNYDVEGNTNKDLWELFHILESYIEVEDEPEVRRTFINLPLAPSASE